ncbi:MAG: RNA-binding transcriptional accessory protein [Bacteroidales bacterium]|nr:RNA-binding transcriptional accessory protein [Bacteroidales bacterium]
MLKKHIKIISINCNIKEKQVENTLKLFSQGATVPFISRYRKELTGSLDEVKINFINEQYKVLSELEKRKKTVIKTIKEQGKLTEELKKLIENTYNSGDLEDIYLPYKPKRKTKATIAKEMGLEPLAKFIIKQELSDLQNEAEKYISDKVNSTDEAIIGAKYIIAEWINENKYARNKLRNLFYNFATIKSNIIKGKEENGIKYADYFESEEQLNKISSHRLLAMLRGESEGFLKLIIKPPENMAIEELIKIFIKGDNELSIEVNAALTDSYKRLLSPSLENEFQKYAKERADKEAIKVFAENLKQLLLAPPLGEKRVLAIDPGYKTGCKIVCLNEQGELLHNETIYPNKPQQEIKQAYKKVVSLINAYKIDAIAIGNGTASRETESFVKNLKPDRKIQVFIVSENGASIYSASSVAREEFPEYDVTVRGAISIGRRLIDPLAELVKIDPKSIGVGQYQHDVDQKKLKENLDIVVESCVNKVGVDLNTASKHLLSYISGLGLSLSKNIVEYRQENEKFTSREQLKNVPLMGDKSFEQCAGFLRIRNAENPLDNSAVHPECYKIVENMANDLNCSITDLLNKEELRNKIEINNYINSQFGLPTLNDILEELSKPSRDPRTIIKVFEFSKDIRNIDDLKTGMILPGIINNITNFGAFVDLGIKENGLIHISQLKNEFVKNPADIVNLHQHVKVKVINIDKERKRIQLSMKDF